MNNANTLFILAKWGLKVGREPGFFESHMWLLDDVECSMKYVSLHKSKADRATRGGEIVEIRSASDQEVALHQDFLRKNGMGLMANESVRKIVVFRGEKKWRAIWPQKAKTNPMAYKGLGYIEWPKSL